MYSLNIDDKQFEFAFRRCVSILLLKEIPERELLGAGCLIQVKNDDRSLIAEVYKIYDGGIPLSKQELCFPEMAQNTDGYFGLKISVFQTEQPSVTALIPATILLYRNIQWLRHLQLKKKLFWTVPTEYTKNNFGLKVEAIELVIEFLNGKTTAEKLCEKLTIDKDEMYHLSEIIELFYAYPEPPELNEFRKERLEEIARVTEKIKVLYSGKKYKEIQQAAYDIHNVPEIIRTMNI